MKRQFIAGATCPECGQMDKIQRVIDADKQWMECVACEATKDLMPNPQKLAMLWLNRSPCSQQRNKVFL